jgi:hypothetical protein
MKRVVDPPRVTYVRNPLMDDPASGGLVGNKAYWLSGVQTRDHALGTVDVTSGGFGVGAPAVPGSVLENQTIASDGIYMTSFDTPYRHWSLPDNPYTREYRHLPSGPAQTATDTVMVTAKNIRTLTIDPQRAKVSCNAKLDVKSDGPLSITLLGCSGGPLTFG